MQNTARYHIKVLPVRRPDSQTLYFLYIRWILMNHKLCSAASLIAQWLAYRWSLLSLLAARAVLAHLRRCLLSFAVARSVCAVAALAHCFCSSHPCRCLLSCAVALLYIAAELCRCSFLARGGFNRPSACASNPCYLRVAAALSASKARLGHIQFTLVQMTLFEIFKSRLI